MLPEERAASLNILNMNIKKGDKLNIRLYDGELYEGNFFRYIYKGFIIKSKGEFIRVRCLDIESIVVSRFQTV